MSHKDQKYPKQMGPNVSRVEATIRSENIYIY